MSDRKNALKSLIRSPRGGAKPEEVQESAG